MNALPALPTIRKYFFGYLFVRLAKTLAVLVLLGGLTGAGLEYVNTILANATQRYVPSPALAASLERLSAEWGRARSLIEGLRPANALAVAPVLTALSFQPAFPLRPTDAGDFARLQAELNRLDAARGGAKTLMLSRFDGLAGNVEGRLRGFAARLAAEQAAASAAAATAAPSPPGPAGETSATPSPTPPSTAPTPTVAETLYSPSLRRGDVDERRGTLGRGREFFNVLAASAENPENQATLRDAAGELDRLTGFLPAPVVVVEEFIAPAVPARRTTTPGASSGPPAPPVNALKVAEQVARLRAAVRGALLTSWRLDECYDEAASLAETERNRATAAAALVRARWVLAAGQIGLRLAVGLALAFLVLVAADLLQTFFDTATHTGVSAAAVSGARPPGSGHDGSQRAPPGP